MIVIVCDLFFMFEAVFILFNAIFACNIFLSVYFYCFLHKFMQVMNGEDLVFISNSHFQNHTSLVEL